VMNPISMMKFKATFFWSVSAFSGSRFIYYKGDYINFKNYVVKSFCEVLCLSVDLCVFLINVYEILLEYY
jgi:hypothetical protein